MKRFLLFTMLCASFLALEAQTITWTGAGDGTNWGDSNNWDLLHVPTDGNDVIIPDGSVVTIRDGDNVRIKSINVQGNTVLTINDWINFDEPSLFEENVIVNWHFGSLNGGVLSGGSYDCIGTLTNKGTIFIDLPTSTFFPPQLSCVTLNNEGIINQIEGGLAIVGGGVLNNEANGIINFQSENTAITPFIDGIGILNNYGIIRKEIEYGVSVLNVNLYNMGKIEVLTGELDFNSSSDSYSNDFFNTYEGTIGGTGAINLSQLDNFTNSGTFSPGASSGTLMFIGDFTSSDTSKLEVEIEGLNQGTDYDLLAIQGNAIFDGVVDVTMGFEGDINDEFIIATTTGAINWCNLATTATAVFNSKLYDFSVQCRNDNEVVLTITNITDGQTITWTGAGDGTNWSDPNNWSPAVMPALTDDVTVRHGSSLTIDVIASAKSIEVLGTSTINVHNGLTFTDNSTFGPDTVINLSSGGFWSGDTGSGAHISNLTNQGTINISGSAGLSYCNFNNEGTINMLATGALWLYTDSVLNNLATGIIDMKDECDILPMIPVPGYYTIGLLNNYGIIKRSTGSGYADIMVPTYNFGIIEALSGTIRFSNFDVNNEVDGIVRGIANVDITSASNFINNGTLSPGNSTGVLTVIGDFTSLATSKLDIEINGLIQGTEYDLLEIQGDAVLDGVVDITMGFNGKINDEFIIVNTSGTITDCNITSSATVEFNGNQYDFSVACRNNNEVVLTLTNITLGVDFNEATDKNILLFPNPVISDFTLRNISNQNLESASIIDLNGRLMEEINFEGVEKDKIITLQNYATGLYLIKINSETNSIVKKIVKL